MEYLIKDAQIITGSLNLGQLGTGQSLSEKNPFSCVSTSDEIWMSQPSLPLLHLDWSRERI